MRPSPPYGARMQVGKVVQRHLSRLLWVTLSPMDPVWRRLLGEPPFGLSHIQAHASRLRDRYTLRRFRPVCPCAYNKTSSLSWTRRRARSWVKARRIDSRYSTRSDALVGLRRLQSLASRERSRRNREGPDCSFIRIQASGSSNGSQNIRAYRPPTPGRGRMMTSGVGYWPQNSSLAASSTLWIQDSVSLPSRRWETCT